MASEMDTPDSSAEDESADESVEDFDAERELCPDDACIGVLSPEGVCSECGASREGASPASSVSSELASGGVDLVHRNLCPDGSCIGVLGPDGRCKECGRVGQNVRTDPRLRGLKSEESEAPSLANALEAPASAAEREDSPDTTDDREDSPDITGDANAPFADRRLCADGSCIGVIGSAGTCNECGAVA